MPPSPIVPLLMELQKDLNNLTIVCLGANHSITDLIELYDDNFHSSHEVSQRVARWANALDAMADVLDKFEKDGRKLREYLNAQE